MKILVGCTGSVATIKVNELVNQLIDKNFDVEVVATKNAFCFLKKDQISCRVWCDEDEWSTWKNRGDPVLHIELRKWADLLVIAPLDANTLAKIANVYTDSFFYFNKHN